MTAFGKILVFLNLFLSVATGALIVFMFTTRTNWKTAYDDARRKAESAAVALQQEKTAHENDLKQKDSVSISSQGEISSLKTALAKAQAEKETAEAKALEVEKLNRGSNTDSQKIQAELVQVKEERGKLVDEKEVIRKALIERQKELDTQRESAILSDTNARTLLSKNTALLRQVEDLTLKIRELEQSGLAGTGRGGAGPSIVEPTPKTPPPGVHGKVTAVADSLAQVSIGSDSGLSAGNKLIVYRGGDYLGELVLTRVEAKAAAGKFIPDTASKKIVVGDSVATSFTSSQK